MKLNYLVLATLVILMASCEMLEETIANKQIPQPVSKPGSTPGSKPGSKPESQRVSLQDGVEFTTVKNYKGFKTINYPFSGNGFSKNLDVDVSNINDAGEFVPGVKFNGMHVAIWSQLRNTDGNLDVQYEALKKKLLNSYIRDNSIIDYEKSKIGNRDVALVRVLTPKKNGLVSYSFGYLVAYNDNKAGLFMIYDAYISEDKVPEYEPVLDKAFVYMIKTVEFR